MSDQAWLEKCEADREALLTALNGLVGLIQLIADREPELQQNHRFIDALAAIRKAEAN